MALRFSRILLIALSDCCSLKEVQCPFSQSPVISYWAILPNGAVPVQRNSPTTENRLRSMRFWQLRSVTRYSDVLLMSSIARSRPEWLMFDEWYQDLQRLCDEQDRAKLDFILPDDYVLRF